MAFPNGRVLHLKAVLVKVISLKGDSGREGQLIHIKKMAAMAFPAPMSSESVSRQRMPIVKFAAASSMLKKISIGVLR